MHANTPGNVENNPVFIYHDIFNPHKDEIAALKSRYLEGNVGDVEVKTKLAIALNNFLEPIRKRREQFASQKGLVEKIVYEGTLKMNTVANQTVKEAFSAMGISGIWNKISRVARDA